MEYLFQINPILKEKVKIIIYGTGEEQKRIFFALLQQNISIAGFCLKKQQNTQMTKIFGKPIYSLQELEKCCTDVYLIMAASDARREYETIKKMGLKNIIIENITAENMGILIEED